MQKKTLIITLISVAFLSGALIYFFREPIKFAVIKSRAEAYLDRSSNSVEVVAEAKELIPKCIELWRSEKLSMDEKKFMMKTLMEVKNNVPELIGGVPLSDDYLKSKIIEINQIVEKHP